ncbi:MAG TPA: sigma-54 dependent transcriptional regulator [Candidatus Acidoferrales bacterium]|nr:sigma-54 dependent transcriptional regulator [Candidatus Acidoferrales bacterium]
MQYSTNGPTILVGEDEPELRDSIAASLNSLGYSVELAGDAEEVLACLRSGFNIAAVLLDTMLPDSGGLETLIDIHAIDATLPVIMIAGWSSMQSAVSATKRGAVDFLSKPVSPENLRKALTRALETPSAADAAPAQTAAPILTKAFFGTNPRMKEIQSRLVQIAWADAPVLIQGETGSGKEIVARELHAQSPRANKPLVKLNCAALPSDLVESELFGYERGAFTGAFQKKEGLFETADGGTILLDEIGDMDIRLQAKLLQVLQDHEFKRIGGKETIRVDVRVMAATHRNLESAIVERTFREDLYYRLNVVNLHVPALRERREDIPAIADFLIQKHSAKDASSLGLTRELKHTMMNYHWPGNVRELENFVRKLIIFRDCSALMQELETKVARTRVSTAALAETQPAARGPFVDDSQVLERVIKTKDQGEAEAILAALNLTRWNRKQAAARLKIGYKALLYRMRKLGLEDSPAPPVVSSDRAPRSLAMTAGGD